MYLIMNDYERDFRLLRPENTPDGRNVIELELSSCDEWNDKWTRTIEYLCDYGWLWMRVDRLLRSENNPGVSDVILL